MSNPVRITIVGGGYGFEVALPVCVKLAEVVGRLRMASAFDRVARKPWVTIHEGAAPEPSLGAGLRGKAVFDAACTADVERRWARPEQIPTAR